MKTIRMSLAMVSMLTSSVGGEPLSLTLTEALTRAGSNAPAIDVAAATVAEAGARRRQSRAGHLPTLSLVEEVVRGDDPVGAFGTRLRQERFAATDFAVDRLNRPDPVTNARTLVEISQPLFTSGASLHTRRAAHAGEAAALASARRTLEEVQLQTATAYWSLVLATQARDVAVAALDAARQHAADAETAWKAGTLQRGDRLATDLRVAELQSRRIDAEADVLRAADHLTLFLGCAAGTEIVATDRLEPPSPAPETTPDHTRADVLARRWQVVAADHQARAEQAASRPQLGAFARFAADARTPFHADGTSWMAGAVLRWDLFSGFASRGAVDAARAGVRRAEAEEHWLTARVEREIREAQRNIAAASQRVEVADAAVRHANEQLRVIRVEYAQGVSSVASRLDAEAAWRSARLRHLQALYDVRLGIAQLTFASGSMSAAARSPDRTPDRAFGK